MKLVNIEKYKNSLFKNIKNKLSEWLELEEVQTIPDQEVFRFLHSIKGTAGTLQLCGLMAITEQLLEETYEDGDRLWIPSDLRNFLFDLIEHTYEYEHFDEIEIKKKPVCDSQAPLIQIIDDDISMLILLKDVLEEQGWMVITNADPVKATNQYFEMQPDCLILDIQLPAKDGFQILQDIHLHNEKYFIPKIMISIQNDKHTRIKAFKMGADDFIGKPIDIDEFIAKMERHIERKRIFDQSVLVDELTQVYNRRFLEDTLTRYFHDFKRSGQHFTISIIDIDHFKRVNDRFGHAVGDFVLVEFAQFIKSQIRSSDLICRYGGEEFVLIFPDTSSDQAKHKLTSLIKEFSTKEFSHDGQTFSVTFSAGVFTVENDSVTPKKALEEADTSLYEAKRTGRAKVESTQRTRFNKKSLNVSVIDDDIIIRTILTKALRSLQVPHFDLNIAVYEDGPSFLNSDRAKENVGHFLILDGVMPNMDGIEVLQNVKQGSNADFYTVLMLTGRKSRDDIAKALKLGADDYVTKPFSITELKARIERLLIKLI
ncbi:diguanylate cyclase [Peribacillus muralis]|uniref:GGDEF domain-containing response regulator n=1 Tax=Peribacillus muralis TaxID=264697 RepID=UPI000ADD77D0|nr:diguanylate cyclase [Peribacillus muralis]